MLADASARRNGEARAGGCEFVGAITGVNGQEVDTGRAVLRGQVIGPAREIAQIDFNKRAIVDLETQPRDIAGVRRGCARSPDRIRCRNDPGGLANGDGYQTPPHNLKIAGQTTRD